MRTFKEMKVYKHVTREEARRSGGKFVNVKWVRMNKGTKQYPQIRCRLVTQELAYGRKMDELFVGTPSLTVVKLLLALYTMDPDKQPWTSSVLFFTAIWAETFSSSCPRGTR